MHCRFGQKIDRLLFDAVPLAVYVFDGISCITASAQVLCQESAKILSSRMSDHNYSLVLILHLSKLLHNANWICLSSRPLDVGILFGQHWILTLVDVRAYIQSHEYIMLLKNKYQSSDFNQPHRISARPFHVRSCTCPLWQGLPQRSSEAVALARSEIQRLRTWHCFEYTHDRAVFVSLIPIQGWYWIG